MSPKASVVVNDDRMSKATEKRLRVLQRVECANALIMAVASCGRKFFSHKDGDNERIASISRDRQGKLWLRNEWNLARIYISNHRGEWKGFHHGGTLRQLIEGLVKFIREGGPIWGGEGFGHHWGYNDTARLHVVAEGRRLGIIRKAERDYASEMKLPAGMTCADCVHTSRCVALGYSWQARTSCDFHPNRFQLKAVQNA